jgi:hypothetical protein
MTPIGSNDKIDPIGSSYLSYERKFDGESENIKIIFFRCYMTPEWLSRGYENYNWSTVEMTLKEAIVLEPVNE